MDDSTTLPERAERAEWAERADRRVRTVVLALAILQVASGSHAVERVTIGVDGDLDWTGDGTAAVQTIDARHRSLLAEDVLLESNAPGDLVEFDGESFPGALLPKRIESGQNIAIETLERGGDIDAPNVFDFSGTFKPLDLRQALEELLTGDPGGELLAFERKDFNSLGILVILNLGGRFGVERIRIYPRNTVQSSPSTPFQSDFLRGYELFTNDGVNLNNAGLPIWGESVSSATDNKDPVIDVALEPPQYVQHLRLRSTSPIDYEIDEIEVFGIGYLATATYVSDIFDAGQPAVWGQLRWTEQILGDPRFSSVRIRTRTGTDDDPFVFTRVLHGQRDPQEVTTSVSEPSEELGIEEYRQLPKFDGAGQQWNAGPVNDDLVNWSPFSTPFSADEANGAGVPVTSPSPRRYMQIQISFESSDLEAARVIESIGFELLRPPLADEFVAEVFPRVVDEFRAVPFTYAVRARQETAGLLGFDTIEIRTPLRVAAIDRVEILDSTGREVASHTFSSLTDTVEDGGFRIDDVADGHFQVKFPHVSDDDTVVRIHFQSDVLTYSTDFTANAKLSTEAAAQQVSAGDTGDLGVGDDPDLSGTTVLSPALLRGRLLAQVELTPNPFTPNGDGLNDEVSLRYSLLSIDAPRPVDLRIYDLSGRLVRVISAAAETNGRYEDKTWDGRDGSGQLVPPGLYLLHLAVAGDSRDDEVQRVVAVVY